VASTFRGLETGKSALVTASLNQEVTGQNIANANTTGYTRQSTVSSAVKPAGTGYVISQVYNKMVGQGVQVTDIQQYRSDYLDQQYRSQNSTFNYYEYRQQGLTYLTGVMNELDDDSSITSCLSDFSTALQKLAADPTSQECRLNVQQQASTLTQNVNYIYNQMVDLWNDQNESVNTVTQNIQSKADQIAVLNEAIANYERSGTTANDLRDDRNVLLDELSGLVNVTYSTNADNSSMVDVQIGGLTLVDGSTANQITATKSGTADAVTGGYAYELSLSGKDEDGNPTSTALEYGNQITGGELYAHMEMVSNNTSENSGIPYYISQLNAFAQQIAQSVNTIHEQGYAYPTTENGSTTVKAGNFFDVPDDDYSQITGGNFSLSAAVKDSVWNIAASGEPIDLSASSTNASNSDIAEQLYELVSGGTFNSTLNTFVGSLSIASDTTKGLLNTSQSMLSSVSTQRTSLSGVSLDEETTNLIMFQQSYSVASRMVTTIDEMLNTLINSTGRVGL